MKKSLILFCALLAGLTVDAKQCKKACETITKSYTLTYNYKWTVSDTTQGCPKPMEGKVKYTKTMTNHKNGVTVVLESGTEDATAMC